MASSTTILVSTPLMSSSMKRTRVLNGTKKVSCLVDGCTSDLSKCREYHRRHRVCERHSKTPVVFIRAEEQRFCQQCSRFHSLGEFDETKRSCRKRLDGHNRRRRKPQPESLYMSSQSFPFNYRGTNFLQFNGPPWPMGTKTELHNCLQHLQIGERGSPLSSSSCIYNGQGNDRIFDDLKMGKYVTDEVSVCSKPLLHTDCALSLLSTHPTKTLGFDLSQLMQPNVTLFPVQPLGSCGLEEGDEPVDLVPDAHCNRMFYVQSNNGMWKMGSQKGFNFLGCS